MTDDLARAERKAKIMKGLKLALALFLIWNAIRFIHGAFWLWERVSEDHPVNQHVAVPNPPSK